MKKTLLITGSTDGLGRATAKALLEQGHKVLIHGRNQDKVDQAKSEFIANIKDADIETYTADLSDFAVVDKFAEAVARDHKKIDVLINNAGVFKVPNKTADNGIDIRFVVNTIAPYLLTKKLTTLLGPESRVINLSSAAQAPVNVSALGEANQLSDDQAYAQSKLALTMWSRYLAETKGQQGSAIIAVNPASFLGSKMVKEAYGKEGNDLQIGVDILVRAALSDEFANASGLYFDNDKGTFSDPHQDALDPAKTQAVTEKIETILS